MKHLLLFLLLMSLLAACMTDNESQEAPVVDGPALVMFYTDN